ncbi:MAG: hydrogenase maturation protease [Roseiarcus sp.]|jgi:hydrogenase maturation protease
MRLIVFGWGNESRGDDGLGPRLLAHIAAAGWPDVTTVEDYQLQIEHALDLDGCDCSLFVDAGKDTPAPFSFRAIARRRATTHTSHALAPEAVLDVYAQVKGRAPPPAFALCVRGQSFELGEGLSHEGTKRLEAAWAFVQTLMLERSLAAWERAARRARQHA